MVRVNTSGIGADLAKALETALSGEEDHRVILHHQGKDLGVLVSMSDFNLLRALEDRLDLAAAEEALAESDERIPYDDVRRELGLDRI